MSTTLHSFIDIFDANFGDDENPVILKKILIPIIQRDYAQGRRSPEVERVRKRFLEALYDAITGQPITLDFVYGDINEDSVMTPLDGQQRLTTLFLLHWYAAKKENINNDKIVFLKNFSYMTRYSARDFCAELVKFTPSFRRDIKEEIIDQPWFPQDWNKDPTVSSMLVMIEAIDDKFKNVPDIWERLENKAISFYFLPIKDMGLTDELYIKMNSRGKPLTTFEHFKAELEREMRTMDVSLAKRIMAKFDREWMDLLWIYRDAGTGTEADMITDDEFLRYFKFICDVICYRKGDSAQDRSYDEFDLIAFYFSHNNPEAYSNIITLESFFDCWCDMPKLGYNSPTDFLESVFAYGHEEGKITVENRYLLNIFDDCVHSYSDRSGRKRQFPLPRIVLLYAVCIYLQNYQNIERDQFIRRLRIINNLILNSEDQISDRSDRNRMQAILCATEKVMVTGAFDDSIDNNFNANQIQEEKEKMVFVETNPDKAEVVYKLEDHPLLRGQISIIGLDHLDYGERFESLYACDWDKVDCALAITGNYWQTERNKWRWQFGSSAVPSAWIELFHKSANTGYEQTSEVLLHLLSLTSEFTDDYLDKLITDYISDCEWKGVYPWNYYYVKYNEFRPGKFGKAANGDGEGRGLYTFWIMCTQQMCSTSSYMPFLKLADEEHLSIDHYGNRLIYDDLYVESKENCFLVKRNDNNEIVDTVPIDQNGEGIDVENRINKLKDYIKSHFDQA
ncbi:Uncharacterized conserved protein, contains ParB-like and HNH nuclease domains [Ruminococcaceae bacterium KH2T8]|nr:Uncharacterized conserved protein, contains ParB-like and HNH nuclease domains [Ruminococcaceae bacterium KH2T8]